MFRKISLLVVALALAATVVPAMTGCAAEEEPTEKADLRLIEFFDPGCPFCKEMEPTVDYLQDEYESKIEAFDIVDVTTEEGGRMVEEFGIFLTPTFVILDGDGVELDRVTGATTKENMITFIERGIADVTGEESDTPRETIEGEGSSLDPTSDEPATE